MSLKIVQTIPAVVPQNNGIATSGVINLQTGYLRLSALGGGCHIAIIDGNPHVAVSSESSFVISENTSEIIKERVARQKISGITTGPTTTVSFGENFGNPFIVGDNVSILGSQHSGINTTFTQIISKTESSIVVNFNSTAVGGALTVTNAIVSRCVKVEVYPELNSSHLHIAEVQIASQA
jgi:hypothetical protein